MYGLLLGSTIFTFWETVLKLDDGRLSGKNVIPVFVSRETAFAHDDALS